MIIRNDRGYFLLKMIPALIIIKMLENTIDLITRLHEILN